MFWKAVLAAVWNPGKSESRQDKRVSGEQGRGSYKARAGAGGGGAGHSGQGGTEGSHLCREARALFRQLTTHLQVLVWLL